MHKSILGRMLTAGGAAVALAGCATVPPATDADYGDYDPPAKSDGAGAIGLFPILDENAGREANVVLSPVSIDLAFGLLHEGARGETKAQIERLIPPPSDPMGFESNTDYVELAISNALFLDREFRFRKEYVAETRKKYEAEAITVDFSAKQAASDTINGWADKATEGLIQQVISPEAIDLSTIAILANALYFEGLWETKLGETSQHPFLFGTGSEKPFKFVGETFETPHAKGDGWEAVRLPYRNERYAMDIIMPARREVMAAAPSLTRIEQLKLALDESEGRLVQVEIPQFETDFAEGIKRPLIGLGLTLPFDPVNADLFGMVEPGQKPVSVSEVRHVTKLQVYDEGTKAAAVTTISIVVTGGRLVRGNPIQFRADRPFVIVLRDLQRDVILFIGRIADPQPFEPTRTDP